MALPLLFRRHRKAHLALLGASLWALQPGAVHAQEAGPRLNFEQAMAAALSSHPAMRSAEQRRNQADSEVQAAKSGYKPQVSGGLQNQVNLRKNSSYDSRSVYTATVAGEQMLYDFGKVAGHVRKARSAVQVNEALLGQTGEDIGLATAQAWLDVHMQQALVHLAREQYHNMASIAALVADRVAKGATSRSDLVQAQSRLSSVQSMLLGAEAEAMRARLALMHLTGHDEAVDIEGNVPPALILSACRIDDVGGSYKIQAAMAERDGAKADYGIARADGLPTVSLAGDAGYALTKGSRLYGEYRTSGQIGVKVSMPFYQGGGTKARTQAAQYQWRSAEEAIEQAKLEQRQALSAAMAQYQGWAAREPVLQQRVDQIDATRNLYRQQYLHLGTRTLIDLLNSEQEYHGARVEWVQGIHAKYRLSAECLHAGGLLSASFAAPETSSSPMADPVYGPSAARGL